MVNKEIEVRKQINEAGREFAESIKNRELRCLANELLYLNGEWVENHPETMGKEYILKQGFTDNQLKWLKKLKQEVNENG